MTNRHNTAQGFIDGHLMNDALSEIAAPRGTADVPTEHTRHLEQCAQCQAALIDVERVIAALHTPNILEEPPPGLWERIAAEIDNELDGAAPEPKSTTADRGDEPGTSPSRGAPWWGVFAAAAVGALIGGVGIATILNQNGTQMKAPRAGQVVGGTTLEPVAAHDFSGTADMVQRDDGSLELTIEISSAPDPGEGYLEAWLRDEQATQLISLGTVTHDSTTLQVPAGVDLSEYNVVDVSHEHFDGDPSHSGVTLAAGPMEAEADQETS